MQPKHEVADVLHLLSAQVETLMLNTWQLRTLSALKKCRTSALGGHIDACNECGHVQISYNSCRNRHCPKCQGQHRESWMEARQSELLPVPYFHVVFTLPNTLHRLALYQPQLVYKLLFDASWQTLQKFGQRQHVHMGMIAVLHTWGQQLNLHPHVHCIVPGGGLNGQKQWQNIRADGKYLFSVKALSKVFRAKSCAALKLQLPEEYATLSQALWAQDWVVYAKRPFGSVHSVVEYLGRYTHKIAISNHRIKDITESEVTFSYKDYKQGGIQKEMSLGQGEFIRRFALHILPKRFVKIRHYGILSSTWKRQKLKQLQQQMGVKAYRPPAKIYAPQCPCCKKGVLQIQLYFDKRGPPAMYLGKAKTTFTRIKS